MDYTTVFNLKKPAQADNYNVDDFNDNMDAVDAQLKELGIPYAAASGPANTYAVTLDPAPTAYVEGMAVAVKINIDSTGASTLNVNSLGTVNIKKPNGNAATNLKAGSIYTLRFNGTNFILQGDGSSGDATASDLRSGKTASTDAGDITGNLPVRAGDNAALSSSVVDTMLKLLSPDGIFDGIDDYVTITDADFIAANIKNEISLFGKAGTYQGELVLSGIQSGYVTSPTTVTISSVDITKSFVICFCTLPGKGNVKAVLTNSTTLTISTGTHTRWWVVSFSSGVSVQRGTGTMAVDTDIANHNISSVDTAKSFVITGGYASSGENFGFFMGEFNSATQIKVSRGNDGYSGDYAWQVVTFV